MKAVKVTWIDAESTTEWTLLEDLKEPQVVHTLGYLVRESDTTYFIAASVYQHQDNGKTKTTVGDTIAIPKAWTTEMFEIKDALKKKTSRGNKSS